MKRVTLSLLVILVCAGLHAQPADKKYSADWKSLDSRPNPEWYRDARFGIFIHWGLYSVPAWGEKGTYAEWYWNNMFDKGSKTGAFHKATYGDAFKYQDFVSGFKAELFRPEQWADIFARSGARYVVLTSKHHEGFCLWPSRESWNWNSVDAGPHRDLLGDLTGAVRAKGLKMGFYYSLYEWFNPIYKTDLNRYVDEHFVPQFKDVVTRYKPSIIFADGEWDHPSKAWKSEQVLAWLFNESPCRDEVVINDRWGMETRGVHGGYYTTEYGDVYSKVPRAYVERGWEESRGIGRSYGFNRNEDIEDYQTPESLVQMLVEIVSKGGNLLLDIGPAADGTIPVIMQERLLQMGAWLKVNGEAIYSSIPYRTNHEGDAIRFTQSKDRKYVYATALGWPGREFRLRSIPPVEGSPVVLLGTHDRLSWKQEGDEIVVAIPDSIIQHKPCDYAYVFRFEGKPYAETPEIVPDRVTSVDEPIGVTISTSTPGAEVRYTLDGSEPMQSSSLYTKKIQLKQSAAIQARAFKAGSVPSTSAGIMLSVVNARDNGMEYAYYEAPDDVMWKQLPDFSKLTPKKKGIAYDFDLKSIKQRENQWGAVYSGKMNIPRDGSYTFFVNSDDGSKFYLDGQLLVDNDGSHGAKTERGTVTLKAGIHPFRLEYYDDTVEETLEVSVAGPSLDRQKLPPSMLVRNH